MTLSVRSLLAALPDAAQLPSSLNPDAQYSLRGVLPIIIAITAVVAVVILWALFFRKSPRYRKKGALMDAPTETNSESRRRRRRRRQHRSRNPSRAETGGLPPPGTGGSDLPPL